MGALGRVLLWLQLCGKLGAPWWGGGGGPHTPPTASALPGRAAGAGEAPWPCRVEDLGQTPLQRRGPALPSGAGGRFARCALSPGPAHSSDSVSPSPRAC